VGRLQAKGKYRQSAIASVVVDLEALGARFEITSSLDGRVAKVKISCVGEDSNKPITRVDVKLSKGPAGVKDDAPSTVAGNKLSGSALEHLLALGDKVKAGEIAVLLEVKLTAGKDVKTVQVVVPLMVS
jgi:hypothetical protein